MFHFSAANNGLSVLYDVEGILYNTSSDGHIVLRDDYKDSWQIAVQNTLLSFFEQGIIIGFFMGDELTWGGLPYSDLVETVDMVAADFPTAIIYYNEAYKDYFTYKK